MMTNIDMFYKKLFKGIGMAVSLELLTYSEFLLIV